MLTYLPGEVIIRSPVWLSDARLDSAARLIRRFHDATAGSSLAGDQEVVGHGDLGHAVWCCADVAEGVPVAEQGRKVRRMCDAYGWAEVDLVVGEIGDRFRRARDQHAQAGRTKGAAIFDRKLRWLDKKAAALIELSTPWGS